MTEFMHVTRWGQILKYNTVNVTPASVDKFLTESYALYGDVEAEEVAPLLAEARKIKR